MAKNCSGKGLTSHCSIVKVVFESSAQIAQCSRCMVVLCGLLCQASPKPPKLFPESDAFEVDYFLQCATCEKRKLEALSQPDSFFNRIHPCSWLSTIHQSPHHWLTLVSTTCCGLVGKDCYTG